MRLPEALKTPDELPNDYAPDPLEPSESLRAKLSAAIEGFEPLHDSTLGRLGDPQPYELTLLADGDPSAPRSLRVRVSGRATEAVDVIQLIALITKTRPLLDDSVNVADLGRHAARWQKVRDAIDAEQGSPGNSPTDTSTTNP